MLKVTHHKCFTHDYDGPKMCPECQAGVTVNDKNEPVKSEGSELNVSPAEIDKIVCEWSMEFRVPMTELAQEALVDRLCQLLGAMQ